MELEKCRKIHEKCPKLELVRLWYCKTQGGHESTLRTIISWYTFR